MDIIKVGDLIGNKQNTISDDGFGNITVPTSNIHSIRYYIYESRDRKKVKEIELNLKNGDQILISNPRARRQFLSHIGLPFRKTEKIDNWKERDRIVAQALVDRAAEELNGRARSLVFRCYNNNKAWSVVTQDYTEIPIPEVQKMAFDTLNKITGGYKQIRHWNDGAAHFHTVLLYDKGQVRKVGDVAEAGLTIKIGYSGDRGLGVYPFWRILTCSNGMMSSRGVTVYKGVHRGLKGKILKEFKNALYMSIDKLSELVPMIDKAKDPITEKLEKQMLDKIIEKYPKHIKRKVNTLMKKKYASETGRFKISQALSDLATHGSNVTDNYRKTLSQDSYRILTAVIGQQGQLVTAQ